LRRHPHPPDDVGKLLIGSREIQGPFGLDFEHCWRSVSADRPDDHIVKRVTGRLLKLNTPRRRFRKPARLARSQ
jgi:hypothetical protein